MHLLGAHLYALRAKLSELARLYPELLACVDDFAELVIGSLF